MSRELVDITMHLHVMTDHAIRVSDDGLDENAVWLPLSQIEILKRPGGLVKVTMPEWLATEKGLV